MNDASSNASPAENMVWESAIDKITVSNAQVRAAPKAYGMTSLLLMGTRPAIA